AGVRTAYSRCARDPEPDVLPSCAELGTGVVPFSPLGKGFLTGSVSTSAEFAGGDIRSTIPRFTADNLDANQALVRHVRALAEEKGAQPGQSALAWLRAQQPWIVTISGTSRRGRIDESAGSTRMALSAHEADM